ncbi:helix-turn-helix domain-containing protein [Paenibacillus sp. D51F]
MCRSLSVGGRYEKAKQLLARTAIPVSHLWDYVGLGSRAYFHAWFSRLSGMTPSEYRQSMLADSRDPGDYNAGTGFDF